MNQLHISWMSRAFFLDWSRPRPNGQGVRSPRPFHPKGVAGKPGTEPDLLMYVAHRWLTRWWNSPYLGRVAQGSHKGMDIRNHVTCPRSLEWMPDLLYPRIP